LSIDLSDKSDKKGTCRRKATMTKMMILMHTAYFMICRYMAPLIFFASMSFYASISSWQFCGIEVWVNARGSCQVLPFVIVMIYYYFLSSNEGDCSPDKIRSQITIYASLRC
jgi:hypothetical protein